MEMNIVEGDIGSKFGFNFSQDRQLCVKKAADCVDTRTQLAFIDCKKDER